MCDSVLDLPSNTIHRSLSQPKITPSEIRARNHLHRRVLPTELMNTLFQNSPSTLKFSQCQSTSASPRSVKQSIKSFPSSVKLTAENAILSYSEFMTRAELIEILRYKNIYYIRKNLQNLPKKYTSESGEYQVLVGDHITYRYEILDILGSGTFGKVVKCMDHKTNEEVAIKILKSSNSNNKQGLKEYKIVKSLTKDPSDSSIVKTKRKFIFRFHFFIVFELLSLSLYDFLNNEGFQPVSVGLTKRITVQLLRALNRIHDLKIIHCDLKPENILFKHSSKSVVKVIDFGSASFQNSKLYHYIQSRFYRAPEIIFQTGYTESIDIWSLGCIIVELLTGLPLFPAENEENLINMMIEVLGMPPRELLCRSKAILKINFKTAKPSVRTIKGILSGYKPEIVDFVERCLKWIPKDRITAKAGLKAKWIQGNHTASLSAKS